MRFIRSILIIGSALVGLATLSPAFGSTITTTDIGTFQAHCRYWHTHWLRGGPGTEPSNSYVYRGWFRTHPNRVIEQRQLCWTTGDGLWEVELHYAQRDSSSWSNVSLGPISGLDSQHLANRLIEILAVHRTCTDCGWTPVSPDEIHYGTTLRYSYTTKDSTGSLTGWRHYRYDCSANCPAYTTSVSTAGHAWHVIAWGATPACKTSTAMRVSANWGIKINGRWIEGNSFLPFDKVHECVDPIASTAF